MSDLIERLKDEQLEKSRSAFDCASCGLSANLIQEVIDEIDRLTKLTEADGKEIGSHTEGTGLRGDNKAMADEIEQLRAGLKCISEGDRPESSQWLADEILAGRFVTTKVKPCIGNDPLCPCQDGLMCHYEGPDAWPLPDKDK